MTAFFLDHNVSRDLATLLQPVGHIVLLAGEQGLARERDEALLLFAAKRDLIIVTHDSKDFRLLHRAWQPWSSDWGASVQHSGIFTLEQVPPVRSAAEIATLLASAPAVANRLYAWRAATGWVERS